MVPFVRPFRRQRHVLSTGVLVCKLSIFPKSSLSSIVAGVKCHPKTSGHSPFLYTFKCVGPSSVENSGPRTVVPKLGFHMVSVGRSEVTGDEKRNNFHSTYSILTSPPQRKCVPFLLPPSRGYTPGVSVLSSTFQSRSTGTP